LRGVLFRRNTVVRGVARGRCRVAAGAFAALAWALVALAALPAFASARTFEVDSTGDGANSLPAATCATAEGECTLRAAIEAANFDPTSDLIRFSPTIFEGELGVDEILPGTPLPPIEHPVSIEGPSCTYLQRYVKPCVGVSVPPGEIAFRVESDQVQISGLSITGGEIGIDVLAGSIGFSAAGDWLGLKLDGSDDGAEAAGIVLGPGADGATIGSAEEEEIDRNVFDDSKEGIRIEGASEAKILGNYIGVDPEGDGPASLETGVTIVDAEGAPGSEAKEDEVGGILSPAEASSEACDGPCNVIATENGNAVDLTGLPGEGVKAASGPTWIRGNYLGLAADGINPAGENSYGVFAAPTESGCEAGPANVTVGGSAPTEANYIDGGSTGLYAEGADNFTASGNSIGVLPDGMAGESPGVGISLCAHGVTERAHISENQMTLGPDAVGIDSEYGAADITANAIQGSQMGIFTLAESEGRGDLIQGNTVTDPDLYGIHILNESNVVIGNSISNSGRAGIELEGADHTRVGGDLPSEENSIVGSGRAAIEFTGTEEQRNEIAANHGSGNADGFILLIPQSSGEPINGGIEPPPFATVLQSSATGTAKPGATVRIFRKASPEAGELASLLAVVEADALGNWKATYAKVPVGTLVAATQTSDVGSAEAGTSEVSSPIAAAADPSGEGGGSGVPSQPAPANPAPPPVPVAPSAPKLKITKRPAKSSRSTTATFKFTATPSKGAKFQCKLDAAKWAGCKSPKTYKNLKPGRHTFQVRVSVPGSPASKPAKFQFTVKP
jgi:nitrous oxidase accessory protein NosD